MQIVLLIAIALVAVMIVLIARGKRDRGLLLARLSERGVTALQIQHVKKGHPFPDTGRGWWVWRVRWQGGTGEQTSWVLTTRDGIKEWRD